MDLANEYKDLENRVHNKLTKLVEESDFISNHIRNAKALKLYDFMFDYEELTIVHNQLTFLNHEGHHFGLYAECDLNDLILLIEDYDKEPKHKIKRKDLYDFAAGIFLSNEDGLSSADQYDKLIDVWEIIGEGDDYASKHVNVWQPFENYTFEQLAELIDVTVENMKEKLNIEEV